MRSGSSAAWAADAAIAAASASATTASRTIRNPISAPLWFRRGRYGERFHIASEPEAARSVARLSNRATSALASGVDRIGSGAGNEQRQRAARDREILQEMIELVAVGEVGVRDQRGDDAEQRDRD